jgi:sugar-phosphatase
VPVSRSFAALLFDLDGTLVRSDAPIIRGWARWAAKREADLDAVLAAMPGRPGHDVIHLFAPGLDDATVRADTVELLAGQVGDVDGVTAIAGADALLRALPADRWGVVTSADRVIAHERLVAAGLPVPGVLVSVDDVTKGKPDPEGFLAAAARLGVDPAACLVAEDAEAGLRAAEAAGMARVHIGVAPAPRPVWATVADFRGVEIGVDANGSIAVTVRSATAGG